MSMEPNLFTAPNGTFGVPSLPGQEYINDAVALCQKTASNLFDDLKNNTATKVGLVAAIAMGFLTSTTLIPVGFFAERVLSNLSKEYPDSRLVSILNMAAVIFVIAAPLASSTRSSFTVMSLALGGLIGIQTDRIAEMLQKRTAQA